MTAPRLSQDELRRILAVAQILRDIGATLVAELDADQVMKTVTGAARKLTGASMGAFLRVDADEPDGPLFVRAISGRRRESSLGVASARSTRPCSPRRSRGLAPVPARRRDGRPQIRRHARRDHARARTAAAKLHRDGGAVARRRRRGRDAPRAYRAPNRFTAAEEQLLADIAAQAGIVLDIARLFRAAEVEIAARRRAEEVQRFYAETSAVLSLSLDYPGELRAARAAVRAVPRRPVPDRRRRRARRAPPGGGARRPGQGALWSRSSRRTTRPTRTARIRPPACCAAAQPEVAADDQRRVPARRPPATTATSRSSRSSASRRTCACRSRRGAACSARSRSCRRDRAGASAPATSRSPRSSRAAPGWRSTTRACTPSATTSRGRCSRACCRRHFPRSPARTSPRDTRRPVKATKSAATSTTCSKSTSRRGGSSSAT